jgi:ferredoxin
VDLADCVGCGLCVAACNVKALSIENDEGKHEKSRARVAATSCLGCGACISSCPTGALSLVPVERPEIPENRKLLFKKILKEKNRLTACKRK